jgi:hypothetical protein
MGQVFFPTDLCDECELLGLVKPSDATVNVSSLITDIVDRPLCLIPSRRCFQYAEIDSLPATNIQQSQNVKLYKNLSALLMHMPDCSILLGYCNISLGKKFPTCHGSTVVQ